MNDVEMMDEQDMLLHADLSKVSSRSDIAEDRNLIIDCDHGYTEMYISISMISISNGYQYIHDCDVVDACDAKKLYVVPNSTENANNAKRRKDADRK